MNLMHKTIIGGFVTVTAFFLAASSSYAATYYWVGGTTNSNTSNAANWNTVQGVCANSANVTVPSTLDTIIFGSSCVSNATVDTALAVTLFATQNGYTGTITVSGTTLNVGGQLTINAGNLYITDGGTVTVASGNQIIIGDALNSNGTITVSGSGSVLTNSNARVRLGNSANAVGNLIIQNGATANIGNMYSAYAVGSVGNLTVDGLGTVLNSDMQGGLGYIGRAGTATTTISNGAVINSLAAPWQIGGLAGAVGTVNISGSGSQLNMTASSPNLRIGFAGTGTVNLTEGGALTVSGVTGKVTLADQLGSSGTLTVGTGYTLDVVEASLIQSGLGTSAYPPLQPEALVAAFLGEHEINWDWNDTARSTGYKVYSGSDVLLKTIGDTTSEWRQSQLAHSTAYSVYVRGTNAQGEGYASDIVTASTVYIPMQPASAGFSVSKPPECAATAPVGTPDLFQILRIKNSAVVFFTPVLNSTNSYLVMYGHKEGEERYGASLESLTAESNLGVQKLAISDLDPNQEYWFKVAPKNSCAVGQWSNWLKAPKWQGKPKLYYK